MIDRGLTTACPSTSSGQAQRTALRAGADAERYVAKDLAMAVIVIGSFVVFSALCAIAMRLVIRQPKLAAVIAAVVSSALLQVATAIHLGYFDPFWPFAFGMFSAFAFGPGCCACA